MKIDVTEKELQVLRQQAMKDLLSSDGFGNPDLFDGDFISHGRKKDNHTIQNNLKIEQTCLLSMEYLKKYENQACILEQNGEFYELCLNVRSIPKIDCHNYRFISKEDRNILHQSQFSSKIVKAFSSLLQIDEKILDESKIKIIATNYKKRVAR